MNPSANYVNRKVARNFNHELETRCKCGRRGLNYCDGGVIRAELVAMVQVMRDHYSKRAGKETRFYVTSGVRCELYNAYIYTEQGLALPDRRGSHVEGEAIDLICPEGFSLYDFYHDWTQFNPRGGLGLYPKWTWNGERRGGLHIDIREDPPGRRWYQTASGLVVWGEPPAEVLELAKRTPAPTVRERKG